MYVISHKLYSYIYNHISLGKEHCNHIICFELIFFSLKTELQIPCIIHLGNIEIDIFVGVQMISDAAPQTTPFFPPYFLVSDSEYTHKLIRHMCTYK